MVVLILNMLAISTVNEEMVYTHFIKLIKHTVSFISVSNSCKNHTMANYEPGSVVFASCCDKMSKDSTENRGTTDNVINCNECVKFASVHETSVNTFYIRSDLTWSSNLSS
jgi:hypothetical protein